MEINFFRSSPWIFPLVPLRGGEGDELRAGELAGVAEFAEARVAELPAGLRRQGVLVLGGALSDQLLACL